MGLAPYCSYAMTDFDDRTLQIDFYTQVVTLQGKPVELTRNEYRVLAVLAPTGERNFLP